MALFNLACKRSEEFDPFDVNCPKYVFTPRSFTANQVGNGIYLKWELPVTNISGFKIDRKTGNGEWVQVATLEKDVYSWTDNGITGEEFYEYKLYAYAGDNESISIYVQITPVFDFSTSVSGSIIKMKGIVGGTYCMGISISGGSSDEKPRHIVTLNSFYIEETEVTQSLWYSVMGSNPSFLIGDDKRPVENVNWFEVQEFIEKLNDLTNSNFRLPTEAEWEYAAGGGDNNRTEYSGTNSLQSLATFAWYFENSGSLSTNDPNYGSHPVKQRTPNSLGLYDMSGNVREWVQDWHTEYTIYSQDNPIGPENGTFRVIRGGAWTGYFNWDNSASCKVTAREYELPEHKGSDLGFRLVHPLRK
jgi:formylglycine-generating enzyme required for sulfatase activity